MKREWVENILFLVRKESVEKYTVIIRLEASGKISEFIFIIIFKFAEVVKAKLV